MHPMDALTAVSLAEVPGCELSTEKTWLYQKAFEVDGAVNKELFCSLCNRWATRRHRLSKAHVDRVCEYGDRSVYMRVKAEPRQRHRSLRRGEAKAVRGGQVNGSVVWGPWQPSCSTCSTCLSTIGLQRRATTQDLTTPALTSGSMASSCRIGMSRQGLLSITAGTLSRAFTLPRFLSTYPESHRAVRLLISRPLLWLGAGCQTLNPSRIAAAELTLKRPLTLSSIGPKSMWDTQESPSSATKSWSMASSCRIVGCCLTLTYQDRPIDGTTCLADLGADLFFKGIARPEVQRALGDPLSAQRRGGRHGTQPLRWQGGAPSSVRAKLSRKLATASPQIPQSLQLLQVLWPRESAVLSECRGTPEETAETVRTLIAKHGAVCSLSGWTLRPSTLPASSSAALDP